MSGTPAGPPREPHGAEVSRSEQARACLALALELPDAKVDHPFGPQSDLLRVGGKIFAMIGKHPTVSAEHWFVSLKVDPELVPGLLAAHDDVRPGWHLNKRHWVSVVLHPGLDQEMLEQLVEDAYDLVVSRLPVRLRPITHQPRRGG